GAMFDPEGFNGPAERAIFWTRSQLEASAEGRQAREKRWEFLAERPRSHREDGYLYVHGSARNPLNEYVFPEDVYNQRKMERIFALVERYCFQGHTHVPGVFVEQAPDDLYQFHSPEEVGHAWRLDGRKTLCNVGSVGQPRDGDPETSRVPCSHNHATTCSSSSSWRCCSAAISSTRAISPPSTPPPRSSPTPRPRARKKKTRAEVRRPSLPACRRPRRRSSWKAWSWARATRTARSSCGCSSTRSAAASAA